jgi:hypothetical protein
MQDFGVQIEAWCEKTEGKLDKVIHSALSEFVQRLIRRTPVGNPAMWKSPPSRRYVPGMARAGWHIGTGAPVMRLPLRPDATGRATAAACIAAIPVKPSGKLIYISNNVRYIWELERGYSRQTPPNGMVGLSVMEFNSIMEQKAMEVVR